MFQRPLLKRKVSILLITHWHYVILDVTLHDENTDGDIGSPGSLHRLLRGLADQRAQKRDEFISVELTNHLFQSGCKSDLRHSDHTSDQDQVLNIFHFFYYEI